MKKILSLLLALLLPALVSAQVYTPQLPSQVSGIDSSLSVTSGNLGVSSNIAKASTLYVCASNTIKAASCDVQLTGTADQTLINSAIAGCGNANMSAAWTGSISGTVLT